MIISKFLGKFYLYIIILVLIAFVGVQYKFMQQAIEKQKIEIQNYKAKNLQQKEQCKANSFNSQLKQSAKNLKKELQENEKINPTIDFNSSSTIIF